MRRSSRGALSLAFIESIDLSFLNNLPMGFHVSPAFSLTILNNPPGFDNGDKRHAFPDKDPGGPQ
jgi:hypothetical protein